MSFLSVETVEGSELKLERLTRADMGAYLCIASNKIPSPVSKRIMIHVHCEFSWAQFPQKFGCLNKILRTATADQWYP